MEVKDFIAGISHWFLGESDFPNLLFIQQRHDFLKTGPLFKNLLKSGAEDESHNSKVNKYCACAWIRRGFIESEEFEMEFSWKLAILILYFVGCSRLDLQPKVWLDYVYV